MQLLSFSLDFARTMYHTLPASRDRPNGHAPGGLATLVFGKGNVSGKAMVRLVGPDRHFVAALPANKVPGFTAAPLGKFAAMPRMPGTSHWPEALTLDLFHRFFEVRAGSIVYDLGDDNLEAEE